MQQHGLNNGKASTFTIFAYNTYSTQITPLNLEEWATQFERVEQTLHPVTATRWTGG